MGEIDRLREPEGWRRQDHHDRQHRRLSGARRSAGAACWTWTHRAMPRAAWASTAIPSRPRSTTCSLPMWSSLRRMRADRRSTGLSLVPSHRSLAGAEVELVSVPGRERRLKRVLRGDRWRTTTSSSSTARPPSASLTVNALTAAHSVLIPIQCEYYALEGLGQLLATIELVREHLNPALALKGVILTMHDGRTSLSADVTAEVRRHLGGAGLRDHRAAERAPGGSAELRSAHRRVQPELSRRPSVSGSHGGAPRRGVASTAGSALQEARAPVRPPRPVRAGEEV